MQELKDLAATFNGMTDKDKASLKRRLCEPETQADAEREFFNRADLIEYEGNRHERRRQAALGRAKG